VSAPEIVAAQLQSQHTFPVTADGQSRSLPFAELNRKLATIGAPYEWLNARLHFDASRPQLTEIGGRRILAANSQFLSAPHAADLNLGTAFTVLMVVNKAVTLSQQDCCFISKGSLTDTNAWSITGGDNGTYGGDSINMWTKTGGSTVRATIPQGSSNHFLTFLVVRYNAGTVKIRHNGVTKTVTGSLAASLVDNTSVLRIGRDPGSVSSFGHKNFDGSIALCQIWNRELSDGECDSLDADVNQPVWYSQLSSGLKSGLVRHWEQGDLIDKVNGVTLTANGSGTIDYERRAVAQRDRVQGLVLNTAFGKAPKISSGIFGEANSLHFDAISDIGLTVGHSRCGMRAALNSPVFTGSTGTLWTVYRLTHALSPSENWFATIDNGALQYLILGGYSTNTTQFECIRYRTATRNGAFYRSGTNVALNTNYREIWSNDGLGGLALDVNAAAANTEYVFGGAQPSFNDSFSPTHIGYGLNGGSTALGHLAGWGYFEPQLSADQLLNFKAWLAMKFGN
jgi:hypothetical protein